MTGLAVGSTAMALKDGLRGLMTSLTPVMVPPVPTPETRISTLPSVSFQISSAVGRRGNPGVGAVFDLGGLDRVGGARPPSPPLAMAPPHPLAARAYTPFGRHGLGH